MKRYEEPSLELVKMTADVITASTYGGGIVIFDDDDDSTVGGVYDPYGSNS